MCQNNGKSLYQSGTTPRVPVLVQEMGVSTEAVQLSTGHTPVPLGATPFGSTASIGENFTPDRGNEKNEKGLKNEKEWGGSTCIYLFSRVVVELRLHLAYAWHERVGHDSFLKSLPLEVIELIGQHLTISVAVHGLIWRPVSQLSEGVPPKRE
eukprot:COSAG03_NODE_144_length_11643_cov_6.040454_1_plen_153_part_00